MAVTKAQLKLNWNGNTKGNGTIKGDALETKVAIPQSSGVSGKGTNPKELLVASAASCYKLTLVAMLEARKLPVVGLSMETEATNSKEEGFKITHYPQVILSAEATEEEKQTAKRTIEAADKGCKVGNMLKKADVQINIIGKVLS
jgi:lipoyl-dependent peroxiredoxin